MSTFSNVHLALQALLTHQQALTVTEHNVANAATPGYHRQEAILRAGPVQGAPGLQGTIYGGMIGTGVLMVGVKRYALEFSDLRYRSELAETKRYQLASQYLQQVEGAMADLGDAGISAKLDAFFASLNSISSNPSDLTMRADLLEQAKSLASAFNSRIENLLTIQNDMNLAIIQRVEEINTISTQIARLNAEIGRFTGSGTQANDFMDERDLLLDRLSELSGAKITYDANGMAMVSVGGHVLVHGITAYKVITEPEPTNFNLVKLSWEDGQAFNVSSGELAGLLETRDGVIMAQKEKLDNLASQFAAEINTLHRSGYGLNESIVYDSANPPTGALRDFFTVSDPNNPALSLRVNSDLEDVSLISLAKIIVPAGAVDGDVLTAAPEDARIAEDMFNLKSAAITYADGTVDTFSSYNTMRASALGLKIRQVSTFSSQHNSLLSVLNEQRESVSGVSLDEEAANLLKFQRSYQAAVRLMTAVDEMMEQIVTRLGLVGR